MSTFFGYFTHNFMKKTFINKILRVLMFQENMNVSQLARETSLPQQTLQRLVSGTSSNPHEKTVNKLADFFGLTIEQLKGETTLPTYFNNALTETTHPQVKSIPVVSWEHIEIFLKKSNQLVHQNFIWVNSTLPDDVFGLVMNDSSMEPYIPENSALIFSLKKQYKDREFVLVKLTQQNTILFRQILLDGDKRFLKPMNPDLNKFSMRILGKKDKVLATLIEYRYCYSS